MSFCRSIFGFVKDRYVIKNADMNRASSHLGGGGGENEVSSIEERERERDTVVVGGCEIDHQFVEGASLEGSLGGRAVSSQGIFVAFWLFPYVGVLVVFPGRLADREGCGKGVEGHQDLPDQEGPLLGLPSMRTAPGGQGCLGPTQATSPSHPHGGGRRCRGSGFGGVCGEGWEGLVLLLEDESGGGCDLLCLEGFLFIQQAAAFEVKGVVLLFVFAEFLTCRRYHIHRR